jgi:predicted PurR-regulated permease PerM
VVIGLVVALALLIYFIRETIPILVLAVLVAYLLNPIVTLATKRLKIPRAVACALVYLVLIAVLIEAGILIVPNIIRQLAAVIGDFDALVIQILAAGRDLPVISNWAGALDPTEVSAQLREEGRLLLEQSPRFLAGAASSLLSLFLVLVLSLYLLIDSERFQARIHAAVPPTYRGDYERIMRELDAVWAGFLRGQILLALIIGIVTTIALTVLGVRNALLLGILAGVLEVVPNLGPILAMVPAVLIAFFQGSTNWAIDNTIFALLVVATYFAIQQLENHIVVPNVLGASVNLPPVLILAGTVVGASLGGVLGIFLAAPVLATARLFFRYVFSKLLEPLPDANSTHIIPPAPAAAAQIAPTPE